MPCPGRIVGAASAGGEPGFATRQRHLRVVSYPFGVPPAVIQSDTMRRLVELVERVSGANAAVLTGKSGTGKELVARTIHHYSLLCARPWIDLNCAARRNCRLKASYSAMRGARSAALMR